MDRKVLYIHAILSTYLSQAALLPVQSTYPSSVALPCSTLRSGTAEQTVVLPFAMKGQRAMKGTYLLHHYE